MWMDEKWWRRTTRELDAATNDEIMHLVGKQKRSGHMTEQVILFSWADIYPEIIFKMKIFKQTMIHFCACFHCFKNSFARLDFVSFSLVFLFLHSFLVRIKEKMTSKHFGFFFSASKRKCQNRNHHRQQCKNSCAKCKWLSNTTRHSYFRLFVRQSTTSTFLLLFSVWFSFFGFELVSVCSTLRRSTEKWFFFFFLCHWQRKS